MNKFFLTVTCVVAVVGNGVPGSNLDSSLQKSNPFGVIECRK
jgi:hypothetical protein